MDKIKIHGIEFFANHGLFQEEAENGQIFIIDCEFQLDTSGCIEEIEKTVHYGEVTIDIVEFATKNRYDLLETLANNLVKFLLQKYMLMTELTITVHKPSAPIPAKFSDITLTVTRKRTMVYLGIGSNLGEKHKYLDMVMDEISGHEHMLLKAQSKYITTAPYGVVDQPDFLNGAVKLETYLTPNELLSFCQSLEEKAGRERLRNWGERTLDVDILFYGDKEIFTENLKIPHPDLHKRIFVLKPLCEIAPYLYHEKYGANISELLDSLI